MQQLAALLCVVLPLAGAAQTAAHAPFDPPARGAAAWRTLETEHFRFHYKAEFETWTRRVAARMEAVREAVRVYVGYAPSERVTILVDDPRNEANGNAISWIDNPQIQLFPVPPSPRAFGQMRDWGELLSVHEFGHIAHLARPSRGASRWQRLVPLMGMVGPLSQRLPRWSIEGYATVIEGALTGSGRPASAMRAAILRQFASEGLLPTYAAIDGTAGFLGGSFAYLLGSAYLEHLAATYGDSTLPQLWRRMSAGTSRTFARGFEETFGVRPDDAYARYVAQLTASAIAMERALDSVGRVEGTLEARGANGLGDPAVSPNGEKVAIALPGAGTAPGRLVIWPAPPTPPSERDSARRAEAERIRKRDSLDLPPVEMLPRGKRVLASLRPTRGFAYRNPRFLPDNERLLVIRSDVRSDGSQLPDLFVWNSRTGSVRRVTSGGAIREADPFPDGARAAGIRCVAGQCDLVLVSLQDGSVSTLRSGSAAVQYSRPRVSPDGARIAASQLYQGRWRPMFVDVATGAESPAGPDDSANRYDLAWTRDGSAILAVTDASGVPNIERIDANNGRVTPLTRVFGAALAPEPLPGDSAMFLLSMTARGYDLRRLPLHTESELSGGVPMAMLDMRHGAVATQPGSSVPAFDSASIGRSRRYGLGPQRGAWLPFGGGSIGGGFAGLMAYGSDPNERFSWTLQHSWEIDEPTDAGTAVRGVLRVPFVEIGLEGARASVLGDRWIGGSVSLSHTRIDLVGMTGLRAGFGYYLNEADETDGADEAEISVVFAGLQRRVSFWRLALDVRGHWSRTSVAPSVGESVTGEHRVGVVAATVGPVRFETTAGTNDDERLGAPFVIGGLGMRTINPALVPQSVAVPWLETGALSGSTFTQHIVRGNGPNVQPFGWAVRTDAGVWQRAAGVEALFEQHSNGFSRMPGISATAGVAWLFDPPNADRVRAWAAVSFRP